MNAEAAQRAPHRDKGIAGLVEGAAAALVFIGAYVPWVHTFVLFTSVSVRGVDTRYGAILPLIPLVALGLLAWRWYARRARWAHLVVCALGVLVVVLALVYAVEVKRNLAQAQQSIARSGQLLPGSIRVGFDVGIYLTVTGGAAMVGGSLLGLRQESSIHKQE